MQDGWMHDRIFPRSALEILFISKWKLFAIHECCTFSWMLDASSLPCIWARTTWEKNESHRDDIHTSALIWMPQMFRSPLSRDMRKNNVFREIVDIQLRCFTISSSSKSVYMATAAREGREKTETANCWYPASLNTTATKWNNIITTNFQPVLCAPQQAVIKWSQGAHCSEKWDF